MNTKTSFLAVLGLCATVSVSLVASNSGADFLHSGLAESLTTQRPGGALGPAHEKYAELRTSLSNAKADKSLPLNELSGEIQKWADSVEEDHKRIIESCKDQTVLASLLNDYASQVANQASILNIKKSDSAPADAVEKKAEPARLFAISEAVRQLLAQENASHTAKEKAKDFLKNMAEINNTIARKANPGLDNAVIKAKEDAVKNMDTQNYASDVSGALNDRVIRGKAEAKEACDFTPKSTVSDVAQREEALKKREAEVAEREKNAQTEKIKLKVDGKEEEKKEEKEDGVRQDDRKPVAQTPVPQTNPPKSDDDFLKSILPFILAQRQHDDEEIKGKIEAQKTAQNQPTIPYNHAPKPTPPMAQPMMAPPSSGGGGFSGGGGGGQMPFYPPQPLALGGGMGGGFPIIPPTPPPPPAPVPVAQTTTTTETGPLPPPVSMLPMGPPLPPPPVQPVVNTVTLWVKMPDGKIVPLQNGQQMPPGSTVVPNPFGGAVVNPAIAGLTGTAGTGTLVNTITGTAPAPVTGTTAVSALPTGSTGLTVPNPNGGSRGTL